MKKVLQAVSKFVVAGFSLAVLILLMTLTYGALGRLFPGNFANQIWGLVMFDIAAMCWAITFVYQSKSTLQYASSAIGFIVAFLGTLGMVAAEVVLSGQQLTQADTTQVGQWMVYGFIIVTAVHAGLVYAHHAGAPEIAEQIEIGIARGEITSRAITNATQALDEQKEELSHNITNDIVSQVKRDLNLIPAEGTPFQPRQAAETRTESQSVNKYAPRCWNCGTNPSRPADNFCSDKCASEYATAQNAKSQGLNEKYAYCLPPTGNRQHPDILLAQIPHNDWQYVMRAWHEYDAQNKPAPKPSYKGPITNNPTYHPVPMQSEPQDNKPKELYWNGPRQLFRAAIDYRLDYGALKAGYAYEAIKGSGSLVLHKSDEYTITAPGENDSFGVVDGETLKLIWSDWTPETPNAEPRGELILATTSNEDKPRAARNPFRPRSTRS